MGRRRWLAAACGVLALCASGRAGAVSLALVTASPDVLPGDSVVVDVVVSDLIAGRAPSLGSFDLDVAFDAPVLGYLDADFGLLLGDPALGEAITVSGLVGGAVDLFELSLLEPAELDALQPAGFVLATLSFRAQTPGVSVLSFAQASLGNAFGQALPLDGAGSLTIRVPEPGSALLWLVGFLGPASTWGRAGRQRVPASPRPR
jgi:hypothetical protein